jgi:alpha-tubulin suppressor-like RCC1 family protein
MSSRQRVLALAFSILAVIAVAVAYSQQPDSTEAASAAAIAAGGANTCSITPAGGARCWGYNYYGQMGDGTREQSTTPMDVVGLGSGVVSLDVGDRHSCAVIAKAALKCWGTNFDGELGDGTSGTGNFSPVPVDVVGLSEGVSDVASGQWHTCAVTSGGGVKCWGRNTAGQLGNGTLTPSAVPGDVLWLDSGIARIAAGGLHTCALTSAGGVKCWGGNASGQVGDGTSGKDNQLRIVPQDVQGLQSGVVSIVAGLFHTCALTTSGGVKCWGENHSGQLGDGTQTGRGTPADVTGLTLGVVAITAGMHHTCAVTATGEVKCWGYNLAGQIGDGSQLDRFTPTSVAGLGTTAKAVAAGSYHTCALTTGGAIRCWGAGGDGQLGNGTTEISLTPVDAAKCPAEACPTRTPRPTTTSTVTRTPCAPEGCPPTRSPTPSATHGTRAPSPTPSRTPTPTSVGTPTPTRTPTPHPADVDSDQDGCTNGREMGPDPVHGGMRDPKSIWDFMDVPAGPDLTRDKAITVADLGAIAARFGSNDYSVNGFTRLSPPLSRPNSPVAPSHARSNYHPAYDRAGADPEGDPWDLLPPDGVISVGDVASVVAQFGHTCA